jgi:hypothetical protein
MNLGQLVGELRMRAEDAEAGRRYKPGTRPHPLQDEIMAFLAEQPEPLSMTQIARGINRQSPDIWVAMTSLLHAGKLARSGEPFKWRYAAKRRSV